MSNTPSEQTKQDCQADRQDAISLGSVRVVHVKAPREDTQGEVVIRVDRTHPVLGNRHILRVKSNQVGRMQVIAAYRTDLEADLKVKGPMYRSAMQIVQLMLDGKDVALACHCSPLACHADVIAEHARVLAAAHQGADRCDHPLPLP